MLAFLINYQRRNLYLFLLAGFIGYLGVTATYNSLARKSFLLNSSLFSLNQGVQQQLEETLEQGSKLQLQDLHRIEVKDGKSNWEITAKDAKYFASEGLTHVNDAHVTVYRQKKSPIKLTASAARLEMSLMGIKKAQLEGGIRAQGDIELYTELATYDVDKKFLIIPSSVKIKGKGFELGGNSMEYDLENEKLEVRGNVSTVFEAGAEFPKNLK